MVETIMTNAVAETKTPAQVAQVALALILTAATVGTGTVQVSGGSLYGHLLFSGFRRQLSIDVPNNQFIPLEMYTRWSEQLLWDVPKGTPADGYLFALFLVLLAAVFHVMLGVPNKNEKKGDYAHTAPFWTLGGALIGLIVLILATSPFLMIATAVFVVVPVSFHLFFYSGHLARDDDPWRKWVYVALFLILPITLVALPYRYGGNAFDVTLRQIERLPPNNHTSRVFVFNEKLDSARHIEMMLVELVPSDTGYAIWLRPAPVGTATRNVSVSLRALAEDLQVSTSGPAGDLGPILKSVKLPP